MYMVTVSIMNCIALEQFIYEIIFPIIMNDISHYAVYHFTSRQAMNGSSHII
jgi:hypothetical protein